MFYCSQGRIQTIAAVANATVRFFSGKISSKKSLFFRTYFSKLFSIFIAIFYSSPIIFRPYIPCVCRIPSSHHDVLLVASDQNLADFATVSGGHFNSGSHTISDMKIRALCPIFGSNGGCKRQEMRLISKLGTLYPLGINERFYFIKCDLSLFGLQNRRSECRESHFRGSNFKIVWASIPPFNRVLIRRLSHIHTLSVEIL